MKLIILGSGTSLPHPQRASPAHWLGTDSGTLLLDIGADTLHRMAQEQLDWANLDAIWLSHFHLDHCAGLAPLLFASRSAPQTQKRRKPLNIFGGQGYKKIFEALDASNNYRLFQQPFPVVMNEVEPGEPFEILPEVHAVTFSTPHTHESLAVRLTDKSGSTVVYTSDTGRSDELAHFATGADLLLMDCSFWRDKPVKKHLELVEAIDLARRASPRQLVLSHLYFEWDGIDVAEKARELWEGETVEARDGLRLEF